MKRFHLACVTTLALLLVFSSVVLAADPEAIKTDGAPQALGPYSQGAKYDNLVYTSGQIALDPDKPGQIAGIEYNYNKRGEIVGFKKKSINITLQTEQVMKNLAAILDEAGMDFSNVLMTTVYLADINDFSEFNLAYAKALGCDVDDTNGTINCDDKYVPPRATVGGVAIPSQSTKGAMLEVSMIAGK